MRVDFPSQNGLTWQGQGEYTSPMDSTNNPPNGASSDPSDCERSPGTSTNPIDDPYANFEALDFPEQWALCARLVERDRLAAMGDLYFIRCGDAVKIGRTTNIVQRLANMQVNSPHEIDCLLLLKGHGRHEKAWQKRFKNDRIRGEWFNLTPELDAVIREERERYRESIRDDDA